MSNLIMEKSVEPLAILFGGMSPEHSASLESFRHLYDTLRQSSRRLVLKSIYYVDRENLVTKRSYNPALQAEDYMQSVNSVPYAIALQGMIEDKTYILNLLHGNLGEDGHIQGLAMLANLTGTFGPVLPASLAMSKFHMQHFVASSQPELRVPETLAVRDRHSKNAASLILERFDGCEIVIKPNSLGASLFTERYAVSEGSMNSIRENLDTIFEFDEMALAQKFIAGREYSIGCVRIDGKTVVLPAVEIKTERAFFGHAEKHRQGKAEELIVEEDTEQLQLLKNISATIFNDVGFTHMCRFDYIVENDVKKYFLEANPIPGLMRNSIFPKMLKHYGLSIPELFHHFISDDRKSSRKRFHFNYSID